MGTKPKLDNALVGAAGVHFVASELSLRGLIALPTIRNAPGIDLVVVNLAGSWHANIQVKTSQHRVIFWPISSKFRDYKGDNNYYAFVRYDARESRFEVFLESADLVIDAAERNLKEARDRGNKAWAPCWPLPRDTRDLERVRLQWNQLGLSAC